MVTCSRFVHIFNQFSSYTRLDAGGKPSTRVSAGRTCNLIIAFKSDLSAKHILHHIFTMQSCPDQCIIFLVLRKKPRCRNIHADFGYIPHHVSSYFRFFEIHVSHFCMPPSQYLCVHLGGNIPFMFSMIPKIIVTYNHEQHFSSYFEYFRAKIFII